MGADSGRRGASGRNILFPRDAVPVSIGTRVRDARTARKMSQGRLAARTGVTRWTILRLERNRHVPGSHLVHALERVLNFGAGGLVRGWKDAADYGAAARGPRARRARLALRLTLAEVAEASGVSVATISRFERECGDTSLILGPDFERNDGFANDAYARAHLFADAQEMETFSRADDLDRWLSLLVARRGAKVGCAPCGGQSH